MSLRDILDRTAARRAAGADQTYLRHGPAPARLPLRMAACPHLGARIPGQPCGGPLSRCERFGDATSRFAPCSGAQRCCQTCPEYPGAGSPSPADTLS